NFSHGTVDQSVCSRRRRSGPRGIRDAVGVHRPDRDCRGEDARHDGQQVLQQRRDGADRGFVVRTNKKFPGGSLVMTQWIDRFVRDEEGQDLVEYAMLLAFIAWIAIVDVKTLGTTVSTFFSNVATSLTAGS